MITLLKRNENSLFAALALILASCILYFAFLGRGDLAGHSEGNYAEIPREMLESGEWVLPHLNYVPYLEKPPLFYWLTALTYAAFEPSAFAARFWSALPALLLVLAVYVFMRRIRGREPALLAALMLATSIGMIAMARISYMDMLLCLMTAGALMAFYLGLEAGEGRGKLWFLLFFAGLAGATLTKGLIGIVLPVAAIALYLLVYRQWSVLRRIPWFAGLGVFLVLALPWHVLASIKHENFTWYYFVNEHWLRFLGKRLPKDYYAGAFYYQALRALFLFLPWTLFLIPAMRKVKDMLREPSQGYWLCWFAVFLGFYTLCKAKANYYMMPALPALAMLLAANMRRTLWEWKSGLLWRCGVGVLLMAAAVLFVFLTVFPYPVLKKLAPGSYPYLWGTILVLASGLLISFMYAAMRRWTASFYAMAAGIVLATLPVHAQEQMFERRGSVQDLIRLVEANADGDTLLVLRGRYEENSLLSFYLKRRVIIVSDQGDVGGDLDYGARIAEHRPYFLQWNDFLQRFGGKDKILFITLKEADYAELLGNHPSKTRLITRSGYRVLIANHPPNTVNPAAGAVSRGE